MPSVLSNGAAGGNAKMGLGNFVDASFDVGQKKSRVTYITPGYRT